MADIRLAKPAAGTTQTVPSAPDGRFIFDFPADAATLTRNGDDLVLTFEDGAAIQLQGFYTTYSKEEMPSFQVDGVEISGQDFFAALDEDLMPAAGPASGSSAARGGRYNEYGGSDLLDGLDHLGRLDIGFDGGTQLATDTVEPSPYSEVDHGVTVTPSTPGTDPDDPSIPVQGEDFPPTMPHDVLQVDESALDGGSGGGSATAAGSMRVSAPDGVAIITIGGVVVWQNGALTGNPVLTDEGHLDVTGFDGTNLTYTYTLTGSTQEHAKLNAGGENDAIAHEMKVVVTDTDGDSGSAVIRVEITDDVPTIESFEKTVTEGDADPIVGNALEGAVAGADGANFAWTNPDQQGRYGKLTLNEDGTYSYELNNDDPEVKALTNGDTRTEEISYTYTDADGDVAEGKVTITIMGVNNGVEVGSGTLTVYEAGLDDGSTPGGGNTPTTASGSLHINAPDGVATIAIGEVTVFKNGALTGNTVSTDEGTLTVTGFDAATGELTFTYTLNDNTLEHGLDGMDTHVSHDFAVTVTDVDDSTASSTITVNIVDDVPTAQNDSVVFEEAAAQEGASAKSVLENDVFGADAPAYKTVTSIEGGTLGQPVQGDYGTLTLNEDGTYTYKLGDKVDVPRGETYTEQFTYTIKDADGDTSTATLTIAIKGDEIVPANPGSATIVVDEALLSDGSHVNSDNSDHVPSGQGFFTVNLNGEDGTVTLKYGSGPDASNITVSLINRDDFDTDWLSENKTLTVNGVTVEVTGAKQQDDGSWKIEYRYNLTGQQTHTGEGVGEGDALSDDIDITVTDATGDTSTGSLTVTVHDDGPVLTAKIDPQPGNDKGHFYDTDAAIVFRLAEGGPATTLDQIDFGADVGTGEEGSAPARITVTVNNTTTFTVEVTRDAEGGLHFSGEDNGTITFEKTGAATGADDGSALTYDTVKGQFTYTRPTADVGGAADNYTFTLTVTDADGDTVQQTGSVVTVFREPTITGDDGSTSSTVTTDEGNLPEQGSGWETDATRPHEDTASGELTVNLDHADGTIQIGENLTIDVDKDGKVVSVNDKDGANPAEERVPGDHGYLSNIVVDKADADGNITIHYTYTLTDAVDGDGASGNRPADGEAGRGESMQADNFAVTVTTANGQTATGSIMANALDDAPRLSVAPEATPTQNDTADSSLSGTFTVNFGADGPSENAALKIEGTSVSLTEETSLAVDGGTLTITHLSGGTYAYTYKHNQQDVTFGKKTFAVVATDGDMDTTQAIITVGQDFHPTTEDGQFGAGQIHEVVTTDESYMEAGGSQAGQNPGDGIGQSAMKSVTVNLHGENTETSITVKHGQDSIRFTYDGTKWSAGGEDSIAVIHGTYGELSVWVNTTGNNVTIGYEYKQTAPYTDHDDPNDANETATDADKFDIEINDGEDTPLTGSISVNIQDDAPSISVTGLDTAVDSGTSAHGNWTHSFGADLPTPQTITVNDQQLMLTDGASVEVVGEKGTLKVNADGTYTYTAKPNASGNDTFTFHITDADGDSKEATLAVAVNNSTVKPENMTFTTQDANVALNGSDSETLFLEEGVTLTPDAVEAVNETITYGTFSLSADGKSLIFTQNSAYTHGEGENSYTFDPVSFAVTDANGNATTLGVTVTITDDAPSISVDQEASGAYGEKITGSVAIDFGADTGAQTRVTVSLNNGNAVAGEKDANGKYTFTFDDDSTLTLNGTTGDFVYNGVPASGKGTSYKFTFTVEDADGDTATATTTATITATDTTNLSGSVMSFDTDVAANTDGNTGNNIAHTVVVVEGLPSGAQLAEGSYKGTYGTITVDASGNATYEQTELFSHPEKDKADTAEKADTVNVKVTLGDGSSVTMPVYVSIIDDVPVMPRKIDFVAKNDDMFFHDNDPTIIFQIGGGNDPDKLEDLNFGADVTAAGEEGTPAQIIVHVNDTEFTIDVTRGENGQLQFLYDEDGKIRFASGNAEPSEALTYDPDTGHFTYTRPEGDVGGSADNYTFKLTLKDSDGDTVTVESLPIRTTPETTIPTVTGSAITVEESALKHGSHPNDAGWKGEGSFTVNLNGEDGSIMLTGDDGKSVTLQIDGGEYVPNENSIITVNGVQVTVTSAEQNGDGWTVKYSYKLTGDQNHNEPSATGADDTLKGMIGITVTDESGDTATGSITVNVQDDGPVFSKESGNVNITDKSDEFWSYEGEISFTSNEIANDFNGKNEVTMQCGDNTLTLQVGKIQFGANGNIDTSKDCATFIDGQGRFFINGQNQDLGIGVHSKYEGGADNSLIYQYQFNRQNEIGYDPISNQSEAVIIRLDKPAVNMSIDLSSFYDIGGADANPEEAIFLFYKDGEYVGKSHLSSDEASGDVQQNGFSALPPGGFDTVVIAASDNGVDPNRSYDNSEFNISAITFNKFGGVDRTLTGQLDATSADGIKGYSVDTDKLATLELKSDGKSISYGWNEDTGRLLAKAGDATVFELVLNTETGAWTMVQYKEYEGELELPFTATDGDDDSTSISVEIPPTDAKSGTYKVTDSDAEKAVLAAAEQEMKSAVRSGEALATAAVLAGMATVLPDEVPAAEGDRPDTPDETLVAAPAEAADAPAALSFVEEGAALPDSPVDGMDDTPLLFANLALAGQEEPMVSAVQTDAADGPLWADASGTDDTSGTVVGETATAGPGAAHPGTAAPEAVLHGTDGDDILLGGDGDELIFGGSGDDFIDGGEGRDTIYAGDGNDIIVYDKADYLVSGGSGIDFMVSDDSELTLDTLLSGGKDGHEGPIVDSIEVLLKGEDALSLTSLDQLARDYGITLDSKDGKEVLQLDGRWEKQDDGSYDFNGGAEEGGLTLETNLQHDSDASSDNGEMAQQVFILEHTNS